MATSKEREARSKELGLRCLVIRGITEGIITVVGIATDRPGSSDIGYSSDIAYIHMPEWPEEYSKKVSEIQTELGYFAKPNYRSYI